MNTNSITRELLLEATLIGQKTKRKGEVNPCFDGLHQDRIGFGDGVVTLAKKFKSRIKVSPELGGPVHFVFYVTESGKKGNPINN